MTPLTKKCRILVVEDDPDVALCVEFMLNDLGHEVIATESRLEGALRQARSGSFDLAILDITLGEGPSYPIAQILKDRGIPFLFATGYGPGGLQPPFCGTPTLTKPFEFAELERRVLMLCCDSGTV